MRKILISFVGTGLKDKNFNENREYRDAPYKFNGKIEKTKFVAKALNTFFQPDIIFLLGTPHSMWEEVYKTFSEESNCFDEDVWSDIGDWSEKADQSTPAHGLVHQNKIEEAIGKDSKIFLIRYGISKEQIKENINIILGLRSYMKQGDEIIFDITHCFRSLPLFIMQLILYLKQIESPKVTISHIYYGMLDVMKELGYAPIVDLGGIVNLSDWISGAYSFKMTGSAKKICSLIENDDKATCSVLEKFSNFLGLNALGQLQQQVKSLSGIHYQSQLEELAVKPTVDSFIKTFKNVSSASEFQFRLAKWQFDKMNYLSSFTSFVESIVTKVCEDSQLHWQDRDTRDDVRKALGRNLETTETNGFKLVYSHVLYEQFKSINYVRNRLVHQGMRDGELSASEMIARLQKALTELKDEMKPHNYY